MGDRTQQIGAHGLLFRFHQHVVLFLEQLVLLGLVYGHTADKGGDQGHSDEGDGVPGQCEIQRHIGEGVSEVHPENAVEGCQDSHGIAVRGARDKYNRHNEDQRDVNHIVAEVKKHRGDQGRHGQNHRSDRQLAYYMTNVSSQAEAFWCGHDRSLH